MVVISSGALSFSAIAAEFGISAPYSLSTLIRGGAYVPNGPTGNANIPTTTSMMKFSQFYGAIKLLIMTISTNQTNYNLYTAFVATYGTPSGAVPVQVTINAGVTIGATSTASPAFDVGQFPTGTTIDIINNGNIWGAGGAGGAGGTVYGAGSGNGSSGGTAIKANYLNQTVAISNTGTIRGGGGGGAGGLKGANITAYQAYNGATYGWYTSQNMGGVDFGIWWGGGQIYFNNTYDFNTWPTVYARTSFVVGAYTYYRGTETYSDYYDGEESHGYTIAKSATGGTGGAGGKGWGYDNQSGPSAGSAGITSPDGGGTGGTGASGGGFGSTGGSTSGGGSGGSAGYYLLKGSATVTITGAGSTAGSSG